MVSNNYSEVEDNNPPPRDSSSSSNHVNVTNTERQALTLNKPILIKMMCNEYAPYLICAFKSTINYIKRINERNLFLEIKEMLKMSDQLILQESLVRNLEAIFATDYDEIESKIIEMTTNIGNNQTEEARFNFFIRYALLDFTVNFMYKTPRVLDRNILE